MQNLNVTIDLSQHGITEIDTRCDLLDKLLEQSRQPTGPRCDACAHWVPKGVLVCWHCHAVLQRMSA